MPKRATMIILGEKEQEALEQLTRRHRSEQQAQRARIILAAAQGSSDAQIGREFEYLRHGPLSWFINFDVVSWHVIEPSRCPMRTEEDALVHFQHLIASDPRATKWRIVLGNLNIHQSEALVRWVVEIWRSHLVRKLLKRGNFLSLGDLRAQILAFIAYYKRTMAKAIKWRYTGLA